MKPEARVFEITSPTNISLNYHFNKFYELKYCFWYAECQSVTYLLLSDFGYNNPIYTTGQNGKARRKIGKGNFYFRQGNGKLRSVNHQRLPCRANL